MEASITHQDLDLRPITHHQTIMIDMGRACLFDLFQYQIFNQGLPTASNSSYIVYTSRGTAVRLCSWVVTLVFVLPTGICEPGDRKFSLPVPVKSTGVQLILVLPQDEKS
jgi:hypothetical protein